MLTLTKIEQAFRASWAEDTCSPDDLERSGWQPDNPAWGHCDVTAAVLHDVLGGDLMVGEVHLNGEPHGYHWWNVLPTGVEIDLTREQFQLGQVVSAAKAVQRPKGPFPRRQNEYELLRTRVFGYLEL